MINGIDIIEENIPRETIQLITASFAQEYSIVPFHSNDNSVKCYGLQSSFDSIDEIEILTGLTIEIEPIEEAIISKLLAKYYRQNEKQKSQVDLRNSETFLDDLIAEAKHHDSSDIHIEVYEKHCRVRYRIDGHLLEKYAIPTELYPSFVNKIKIKANLDIAEKRLPQDGRIIFSHDQINIDIRVSVLPTLFGEKIVMRLLNNDASHIHIEQLGLSQLELKYYLDSVKKPSGIVLISGPTGSGKTTTLYATLKMLNKEKTNILTVEDPIEYTLPGINQVQVKESIGLTFGSALRSFLRQDPDVIMLGEIRDVETANMAIRASLTGHLVLSTIHTNSAWGTISRLIDMGIPPFLLSSTISASIAQRLVRKLCTSCKQLNQIAATEVPGNWTRESTIEVQEPRGCDQCHYTGYKGRVAVYEVIPINETGRELIKENRSVVDEYFKELNIKRIPERAFELLITGETSLEEVYPLLLN
ncbi:MAG: general secretion pathway protein GspE [Crocinitomicaceae bacterium]|nr:general secretion pathway protein GspE [Crocinitomicaceae bacterium]|tara:strand:- start:1561 stop:2982 length:1422 start_codon:yes stop_codon:yes gene_type:complete